MLILYKYRGICVEKNNLYLLLRSNEMNYFNVLLQLGNGAYKNKCVASFQNDRRWPKYLKHIMATYTWGWISDVLHLLIQLFHEEFKRKTLFEQRKFYFRN